MAVTEEADAGVTTVHTLPEVDVQPVQPVKLPPPEVVAVSTVLAPAT